MTKWEKKYLSKFVWANLWEIEELFKSTDWRLNDMMEVEKVMNEIRRSYGR